MLAPEEEGGRFVGAQRATWRGGAADVAGYTWLLRKQYPFPPEAKPK
jgi:hypothetical protein